MAPLPQARLGKSLRCFAHCGVDFAGAFVIKLTRRVTAKRYLCLFTCVSTRAVSLEIAYSLDTASFLNAFSRMVARRGKPEVMISDNGTNFPSSDRELRDLVSTLDQSRIKEQVVHDANQWRFTSPLPSPPPPLPRWIASWRNFRSPLKVCYKSFMCNAWRVQNYE